MDDQLLLRYSRHILLDELGLDAQTAVRLGARADRRRRRSRRAGRAIPRGSGRGHDDAVRRRQRRPHQPAAPDPLCNRRRRPAQGRRGRARDSPPSTRTSASLRSRGESAPTISPRSSRRADVVIDCCDNFATRHAVNRACVAARKPLVSGAAIRFDGQLAVFDTRDAASPCYHCLFGEGDALEETRCATMGVFAPLVGIVGSTQAAEALKLIARRGRIARRSAAAARRAFDGVARSARAARPRMPRVPGSTDNPLRLRNTQ